VPEKGENLTTIEIPELTDIDVAFPASALDWMPPMEEIPDEFKDRSNEWCKIASSWFFFGLPKNVKFYPREGVDPAKAVRAIQATLGSYAPRHQHKEAAVAYMLSCWFTKVKNWKQP
jgi:hypothetical protein